MQALFRLERILAQIAVQLPEFQHELTCREVREVGSAPRLDLGHLAGPAAGGGAAQHESVLPVAM